ESARQRIPPRGLRAEAGPRALDPRGRGADPRAPRRRVRHRRAHLRLGRLGARPLPPAVRRGARVLRRRGARGRARHRRARGRPRDGRGAHRRRPVPALPHGERARLPAHEDHRRGPRRLLRRLHRDAGHQRLAARRRDLVRGRGDPRPDGQRLPHGAHRGDPRRHGAGHRVRADRDLRGGDLQGGGGEPHHRDRRQRHAAGARAAHGRPRRGAPAGRRAGRAAGDRRSRRGRGARDERRAERDPPGVRARAGGGHRPDARHPREADGGGLRHRGDLQGDHDLRRGRAPDVRHLDPDAAVPPLRPVRPHAGDHAPLPARGLRRGDRGDQGRRRREGSFRDRV
ncbi:MAG: L-threonine 3-dehydrogenase, partial [uncultured Gemmatimonadaceae bacterium]